MVPNLGEEYDGPYLGEEYDGPYLNEEYDGPYLGEEYDSPPAGLDAVYDLVWYHLPHVPVPLVKQAPTVQSKAI